MGGQQSGCAWLRSGEGCKRKAMARSLYCPEHAAEVAARPVAASAPVATSSGTSSATSQGGAKADAGKLGTHLLPTRPLQAVARVLDFGARKYAPDNWRQGIAYTRIYGAVLRHLWAWWQGEAIDAESGQPHLACAACELLFLLEYELGPCPARRERCDDRPEIARP